MDFIAIDFETANSSRSSACALGLVEVKDGVITAEHSWLIDPQQRFDGMNISIHGITLHGNRSAYFPRIVAHR